MNDQNLITAMRESFADVQSATPVEQIVRRGRVIRTRRRIPGAVAVAAVAAAAGTAAALLPSGPARPAPVAAHPAAFVVSRVTRALDAMPGNTVVFTRRPGHIDSWGDLQGRSRLESFTPAGRPAVDSGIAFSGPATGLTRTITHVDYQTRTWWRSASYYGNGNVPATRWNCRNVGTDDIDFNPRSMAAQLRTALSCGDLKVAGRGTFGGVPAVELAGNFSGSGRVAYWVNAATYLPFRFVGHGTFRMTLQWLPPTAANLAQLNVRIPAGFTRVRPPAN